MFVYEASFMVCNYIMGFLLSSLIFKKEKQYFIAILSFFTGISFFFFVYFFLLIIFGKISLFLLFTTYSLMIGLLLFYYFICHRSHFFKMLGGMFISVLLFTATCFIVFNYDLNLFCGDTYHISNCARRFSVVPDIKHNMTRLSSWGALFVLIQHVSYELGLPYFVSLHPILYINFIFIFQLITYRALILMNINNITSFSSSVLVAAVLGTSPVFLIISLLLHTNSFLVYYLFLFLAFYWMGEATKEKNWYYFSYIFMLTASFSRVEAPIYCTIVLLCMLYQKYSEKERPLHEEQKMACSQTNLAYFFAPHSLNYVIPFFILIGGWYTFLLLIGANSDILSAGRAKFLACLYPAMFFLLKFLDAQCMSKIRNNFLNILLIIPAIAFIIVFFILPDQLFLSLKGIYGNLSTHVWKGILVFILTSLVLLIFKKKEKIILEKSILTSIFLIILSTIAFSFFRTPFYKNIYDSSNRIFVSLIPIIIFYLTLKFYAHKLTQYKT
jgi:hypothetical protein